MFSRRKFLKSAAMASVMTGAANQLRGMTGTGANAKQQPVVVSTWDYGKKANVGAWNILGKGGRALDAVEAGVMIAEADPNARTVGYGGLPDRDGIVTLDASIMDENYNCGSVMCLEQILHPISVARMIMEKTPHIALAGAGALQFALDNGFKKMNLLTPASEKDWKEWMKNANYSPEKNIENRLYSKDNDPMPGGPENHDTIGMLALDAAGNLSGACTTSGLAYKIHGRVGDSPMIGAGLYVDNEAGAATASGVGEEVMRLVGSHLVVEYMRSGLAPEMACKKAVERMIKINPEKCKTIQVGFLALSNTGQYGGYSIQPGFTYAVKSNGTEQVFKANSYYQ
jgi:N4-(beta-N-acetylglucosaminyl)-L-asparaginase